MLRTIIFSTVLRLNSILRIVSMSLRDFVFGLGSSIFQNSKNSRRDGKILEINCFAKFIKNYVGTFTHVMQFPMFWGVGSKNKKPDTLI